MEVFGFILFVFGVLIYFVGGIQLMIAMFRESVWWFVGGFFIPILPFIFLCVHFHEAWPSLKKMLLGLLLIIIGAFMCSDNDLPGSQRFLHTQRWFSAS